MHPTRLSPSVATDFRFGLVAATIALVWVSTSLAVHPTVSAPQTGSSRFHGLHESYLARGKAGPVGLLFLGDSITYGWRKWPAIWDAEFGKYQPANFGIGSDKTQNVLWRIAEGELDSIAPKAVVLMIGTNNTGSDSAEDILAALKLTVQRIRERLPQTKVLVLAIFPRGPRLPDANGVMRDDGVSRMRVIEAVNARLPALGDGRDVHILNINSIFLRPDGKIRDGLMYDQLHLTEEVGGSASSRVAGADALNNRRLL